MPLVTWEERFAQMQRRVGALELELTRLRGYAETGEHLQDNVNDRVAKRLTALEDNASSR